MRQLCVAIALSVGAAGIAEAQTLREHFNRLYTFGDCGEPLCLRVDEAHDHGRHFIPAVTQGHDNLLAFIDGAIAMSLGNIPVTAAASGVRLTWDGGVPVATTLSPGPFFAERAFTLGAGGWLVGANVSGIAFEQLRGVDLDNLQLRFAHQNTGGPMGDPVFENDHIEVNTNLSLNLLVTSLYGAFGLADRADIQVVVPVVRASLSGTSLARIVPTERADGPTPHAFDVGGQPTHTATAQTSATATGIGDIAIRTKLNVYETDELAIASAVDLRLPTGDPDNFLGSGATAIRALAIVSARYGALSPHLNAGLALRTADNQNHSFLTAVGFDRLVNDQLAVSLELISDLQFGASKLSLPPPVQYEVPQPREMRLSDIPDQTDDLVDVALGAKYEIPGIARGIVNLVIPIADGGLRPRMLWTVGLQRNF